MGSVSCSNNFKNVPPTGFVTHLVENKESSIPFDSYWNVPDDAKVWDARAKGENGQKILMSLAAVDTKHMDISPQTQEEKEELGKLAAHLYGSVKDHMQKVAKKAPNFVIVPFGTKGAYKLELAIISITPTAKGTGVLATGLSFVKGGFIAKKLIKKGHIAIAGRLRDENGRVVSEFASYEEDHDSLLGIDAKNFMRYGHHKHSLDEWAREIAEVYSTPYGTGTRKSMWTLTPF